MAPLRVAPTQPESPGCLKKEGPANRGEMEPPTPATPSTKRSSCVEKQTHTYQMNAADSESKTKTAVQTPSNLVLNSTVMSKELWITSGKDTQCQAS